jgi:tetratricopeptide (TPR) repeat protein
MHTVSCCSFAWRKRIQGRFTGLVLGVFLLLLAVTQLLAHGDLHDRIAALTMQLRGQPDNAQLYFERGELHRQHEEWQEALADFEQSKALNPSLELADLSRGKILLKIGKADAALDLVVGFIKKHPQNGEARLIYARLLIQLNRPAAAAEQFAMAIGSLPEPMPDYYLEWSRALAGAGKLAEALSSLDQGMKRLGAIPSLQLPAIELEVQRQDYEGALVRLQKISELSSRKETWAHRRGEILESAGRWDEARAAYREGLAALDLLPPARRKARMMADLEARLRSGLNRVEAAMVPQKLSAKD